MATTAVTLLIRNKDILSYLGQEKTVLTEALTTSDTSAVVKDNHGFKQNDWVLIGEFGNETSEIVRITASVSSGTALTIQSTTFAHTIGTPIYKLPADQIRWYRATSSSGTKSLLTNGSGYSANPQTISVEDEYSQYVDTTNTTGYYWIEFYDSNTATAISGKIGGWNYAGRAIDTFGGIKDAALDRENEEISERIPEEFLDRELNLFRDYLKRQANWDTEIIPDTSLSLVAGKWRYAVPSDLKFPDSDKAVIELWLGLHGRLGKITWQEYLDLQKGVAHTQVATAASSGDTSLVLDNTYEFNDPSSGTASITVGTQSDAITYTTNTESSATLSGIPSSGDGAITATIPVDTDVWQNATFGLPIKYCVYNGYIYFDVPASSTYEGITITLNYWKKFTEITTDSDQMDLMLELGTLWLQAAILWRKGDKAASKEKKTEFRYELERAIGQNKNNLLGQFSVDLDNNTYD